LGINAIFAEAEVSARILASASRCTALKALLSAPALLFPNYAVPSRGVQPSEASSLVGV
jgi:hypothetical protein